MVSITQRFKVLSDGSLKFFDLQLAQVKTTFEHHGLSRPSFLRADNFNPAEPDEPWVQGYPDTWQFEGGTREFVDFNEDLQYLMFNENVSLTRASMTLSQQNKSFIGLLDDDLWQFNRYGSETCAVYPAGVNLDKENPRYFTLITGRAVIQIAGSARRMLGSYYYPFYTINASSKDLNKYSYEAFPFRWYRPMNSVRIPLLNAAKTKWLYGYPKYKEDGYGRFPHFRGDQNGSIAPIVPLLTDNSDVGFIKQEYVTLLNPKVPIPAGFNI